MKSFPTAAQLTGKRLLACALIATAGISMSTNAAPHFTTFDPPGSVATTSRSISNGAVTGYYQDAVGFYHGFVRSPGGISTVVDIAGASNTYAGSIDTEGTVPGFYTEGTLNHGFLRTIDGTVQTLIRQARSGPLPLALRTGQSQASTTTSTMCRTDTSGGAEEKSRRSTRPARSTRTLQASIHRG